MNQSDRAEDLVTVYRTEQDKNINQHYCQARLRPLSTHHGFDSYKFRGVWYPAYVDDEMRPYIMLDRAHQIQVRPQQPTETTMKK